MSPLHFFCRHSLPPRDTSLTSLRKGKTHKAKMSGDAGPADGDVEAGIPLSKSVREIAYHESFKVANKEIAKLNAENIALKLQLHRISGGTDVEEMESLDELKLAKGNLVAKVTELNVRLEGQHSQHVLDKKEIDSLLSRVKQLADDNCFHTQESHDRAKQAASLTTERDTLKQNLSEIELKCESLTTSNALLKESNSTLHANLTKVSTESAAEIKTLRAEKADALAQSSRSGALHEELKEKYRLISADLESVEESKADEIRGLHEEVAALKDSYQLIDKKAASLAQELEEEQEKKALLEQELATMRDIANDTVQHADQRFFASEKKLEEAIAARNTAEVEVVSLQKKLNTLHPLLSDTQEEGVSVPFSFSQIIEMDANKKIAEEQLLSMQDLYKEATSSKEHDLQTIKKEKARSEQLAEEILDLRFSLSKVEKEQTQLAQWKRDNQLVVNQAKDAVKMNEMLSTQLQYILHEGREDKLDIEYSDIKELQQQNTKLTTQALSIERNHEEEMAAMRESLEETFLARIAKMEEQAAALATERADLEAALSDSAEKCRRLAHSLEICGSRRHQFVTTPHMPAAAPPQTVPMETSSLMEPEDTDNSQELQLLREEVDRLKHELFEAHRNRETSDASFLRLTATIDSRDDTVAHLRDEKEYYKSLMEHSDKSMDEMLKRLLATEEKYRRQQRSEATLEVRLEQALRENEQLLTTNTSFAQGQSKLNDVILHVDAVVGHVNSENLTAEATMRSQRDEVRQKLAEKEKELQESNNVARNLRAQHEQTLTDLNVELATVKEQLVSTTRRFEEEKDAHKHQIIHNKKLGADLDRAESERRIRDKQKVEEGENFLVSDSGEKELRGELAEALKGKAAVAAKVEAYVTTIRKLETELTQCNQRMQEMDTNLAEQQKRGDEAEAREKSRTETWKQDNENLRAREEEVRKTAVNFKASTEALQTRNDALQYELKSGEDERKEALRRCKEAEDEANKIKERYETALVEKGELTKTLQDYHEANSAVHIAPADTRPSLAEGREQQLLAEIATLRSELENVRVTLDSIDPAEGIREHHLAITLDGMRGHSRDLQQRLRDAERGSKLLEAQIDQLKRQQQLAAKQSSQTDAIGKYERRIQNLKDDLQERTHSEEKYVKKGEGKLSHNHNRLRKELEQAQCSKAEVKNAEEVRANLKVVLREKAALENSVRQLTPVCCCCFFFCQLAKGETSFPYSFCLIDAP